MGIPKTTYKDYVIRHIYDGIMNDRYPAGEKILEQELSLELGISRAPVREALRELVGEGLLSHQAQRGHFVTLLTSSEIVDAYQTRGVIEGYAAALAAPALATNDLQQLRQLCKRMENHAARQQHRELIERGEEFHGLILAHCPNRELYHFGDRLSRKLHILFCRHWGTLYRPEEVAARHRNIVDCLQRQDPALIEQAIRDHYFETGRKIAALPTH
ncbi:hypothetical protein C2E25_08800 [Geothermobacter hydrogeniphilus]|uniref:HTH gntR-type domain-containing protein n=1 Tax=Geothermobacter hydrogeniphilus TaxID=1969733 RepID=A0A2K2HA81_9BACT|nr:GntR family transcriptional regulator [Geothermobacter hydrogeniphilus]PNU20140.1 hypothetical protein C2E25_08800 [Geothermobacter hydrogeniphilus]